MVICPVHCVPSEGHISTHKISPEIGLIKQYFFHAKPKLQLRLASLEGVEAVA